MRMLINGKAVFAKIETSWSSVVLRYAKDETCSAAVSDGIRTSNVILIISVGRIDMRQQMQSGNQ